MDTDPYAGLTDSEVLEIAAGHLRVEASLPPHSVARIAAGQQYDRAKAELDRRLLAHIVAELSARPGE
jgi:hypothetical protein